MTTQAVSAQLMLSDGSSVNMLSTLTDGTEGEIKTSAVVSAGGGVSAQSIGTFAEGKAITQIIQPFTAVTKIVYAYISRRGRLILHQEIGGLLALDPLGILAHPTFF